MSDGEAVFARIRESSARPTAVFAPAGDMVAIGVMKMAKRNQMVIPQDLAVVGFDDLPAAEVVEPELSTVRQPKLEMGDHAIDLVIDKIEGRETGIKHQELQTKFITRKSA